MDVAEYNYKNIEAIVVKHPIHVGIPTPEFDPDGHHGALPRISACEFVLGAIYACSLDIEGGADDKKMLAWKNAFLSTLFVFKVVPTDMVRFEAMNLREEMIANKEATEWTVLQKVQMVMNEANTLGGNASASKVSALFSSKVRFAPSSEKCQLGSSIVQ